MKTIFTQIKELKDLTKKQKKAIKVLQERNTELYEQIENQKDEIYDNQIQIEELELKIDNLKTFLERNPYNNYESVVRKSLEYIKENFSNKKELE